MYWGKYWGWSRILGSFFCLVLMLSALAGIRMESWKAATQQGDGTLLAHRPDSLKVHFVDVGQGDCILLQSNGKNMLIDAGSNDARDTVVTYLENQGIHRLDYVLGTHPHEDHIGSLDTVIDCFDIGTVFMPTQTIDTKSYEDVLDAVERKGLTITTPRFQMKGKIGKAEFIFVTPDIQESCEELNDSSAGIRVTYGNYSFLLCGDASSQVEQAMLNSGINLKSDVFKLSHHGSSDANSLEFLRAVNPKYGVISCGRDNDFGHPHQSVLNRMEKLGIENFRTDRQGTVVFTAADGRLTCNVAPWNQ